MTFSIHSIDQACEMNLQKIGEAHVPPLPLLRIIERGGVIYENPARVSVPHLESVCGREKVRVSECVRKREREGENVCVIERERERVAHPLPPGPRRPPRPDRELR